MFSTIPEVGKGVSTNQVKTSKESKILFNFWSELQKLGEIQTW